MDILKLKAANCKNCYKCVRNCPVKSIAVKEHQARIIEEGCILCGSCMRVCPQNAKVVRDDVPRVKALLELGKTVIASVAPSFPAAFHTDFESLRAALLGLGFSDAQETALGAALVKTKYEELVAENRSKIILSSCCPTVVRLIQNQFPENLPWVAPVLSPMQAHFREIRRQLPDASVVFLGPCISKKDECEQYEDPNALALTFDELKSWLGEEALLPPAARTGAEVRLSRFFPVSGGILNTMEKRPGWHYLAVDGVENCMALLRSSAGLMGELDQDGAEGCFIELSACTGGCVSGPGLTRSSDAPAAARIRVERTAVSGPNHGSPSAPDFPVHAAFPLEKTFAPSKPGPAMPSDGQIDAVLRKMGKYAESDELNCGTCGYSTCREKAVAVFFGKAEISMCLPYMKERAESMNFQLVDTVPNAIVAVGLDLTIQLINREACRIFGVSNPEDVIGAPVSRVMDEFDFVTVIASETGALSQRAYLAEYDACLEEEFRFDKQNGAVLCVMKDVTKEEKERELLTETRLRAAAISDKIIEKQLGIVHEIASLLGETAAETQVALTDLKNAILIGEQKPQPVGKE